MTEPTDEDLVHARTLWDYHRLDDALGPSDVIIGLGGHDISVAEHAANLWHAGLAPVILFSGANAPTTVDRFPRGEAVHYRERAMELGVPDEALLLEPFATNTGENVVYGRQALATAGYEVETAIVVSRPYQQRRARATFRKQWASLKATYTAMPCELEDYLLTIGDDKKVLEMLVGDTQRIGLYARLGLAVEEEISGPVAEALGFLVMAGYTRRIVSR